MDLAELDARELLKDLGRPHAPRRAIELAEFLLAAGDVERLADEA